MKVLLVEDSAEVSVITVEYLLELGHQVVAVANAEQAIAQLKGMNFDAVMTDIRLPGMSGIQLAEEIHQAYPKLPVVICSGYEASQVARLLAENLSTVLVLSKPYDLHALERTLAEATTSAQRDTIAKP